MIEPLFGNIRNVLIEKLKNASFDVYIAVAWITDKKYEDVLVELLQKGVSVIIITVNDEINLNGNIDWTKLIKSGAQIFWDNHHHKFCVIDRKIVITGSFNWTYMASNRINRENILVIDSETELINEYSKEFMKLKSSAIPFLLEPEKIIQEVVVEKEIERIIVKNINNLSKYNAYKTGINKLLCGKCSSNLNTIIDSNSVPKYAKYKAKYHCKNCGSYFSSNYDFI